MKARIESAANVHERLVALGATLVKSSWEDDEYFTIPGRDVLQSKECLRIRQTKNSAELTYKGPSSKAMHEAQQFWKHEVNIPITGNEANVRTLLTNLGCESIVRFRKERSLYSVGEQHVAVDRIVDVGAFVEVESITDGSPAEAVARNRKLLAELGVDEQAIVHQPYRDLVLQQRVGSKTEGRGRGL